jgi:GNAT superfamily N-acetyltransferase
MSAAQQDESRALAIEADRIEACAWADWFAAMPPRLRSAFGIEARRIAGATLLLAPRLPVTLFNRSIGLGMNRPATSEDLDAVVQAFVAAGSPTFALAWGPYSEPTGLVRRLDTILPAASPRPSLAKMVRGPAPVTPLGACDLRVVAVDRSLVADASRAIAIAHGTPAMADALTGLLWRPRWQLYAAMDRDEVVGGAALFLDGDSAWLGMAGVVPNHRRRGGQGALMTQRIRDAISAGAVRIFTETDEPAEKGANPSLNNMERCGFEKILSRVHFVRSA